jgi:polysaccharide biosynthesis protein PslG
MPRKGNFDMRITRGIIAGIVLALCAGCTGIAGMPGGLQSTTGKIPSLRNSMGVNIHFTDSKPGEMKMLAEGGFKWVRMDFAWSGTERKKGEYDFSAYDRLLATLDQHGIRALLILDYHNRFYDNGMSPCSDEGRKAFAKWAAVAVQRYKGRGILWEMYNEPNIFFWKPKPDVNQYIALALEVGREIRKVAPDEQYIGPAVSQIDLKFLEECFKGGLLEYWSLVSVHPYRSKKPPETAVPEYARLRELIDKYAPKGRRIPIISGEWGYTTTDISPDLDGKFLSRLFLCNLISGLPLSIWYDWHDDGMNPADREHNFGTVKNPYFEGRDPVYDPKPAYLAAKTLAAELGNYRFAKRMDVGGSDDYVLQFECGREIGMAFWTTATNAHSVTVPLRAGNYKVISNTGDTVESFTPGREGINLRLTDSPQYLRREKE